MHRRSGSLSEQAVPATSAGTGEAAPTLVARRLQLRRRATKKGVQEARGRAALQLTEAADPRESSRTSTGTFPARPEGTRGSRCRADRITEGRRVRRHAHRLTTSTGVWTVAVAHRAEQRAEVAQRRAVIQTEPPSGCRSPAGEHGLARPWAARPPASPSALRSRQQMRLHSRLAKLHRHRVANHARARTPTAAWLGGDRYDDTRQRNG